MKVSVSDGCNESKWEMHARSEQTCTRYILSRDKVDNIYSICDGWWSFSDRLMSYLVTRQETGHDQTSICIEEYVNRPVSLRARHG